MVGDKRAKDIILKTETPNLDILPAHLDLVGAEIELINHPNREKVLKGVLQDLRNNYDFIIIDCSPSLGLITVNSLAASDSVIVPVQCEYFALEGLGKLLNTIKIVQNRINPALEIEGILLTMYDQRLRLSNQVLEEVRKHFQDLVFETIINRNTRIGEAPSFGKPIIMYDADSTGARDYMNLAREILQLSDHDDAAKVGRSAKNEEYEQTGSVVKIPLSQIEVNPFQPRVDFNQEALEDLAESIKIHGVVQPITVRKLGNKKFQLIAGERRLRASKLAGLNDIPAYVRLANDQESLEIALIENIQREDLNALEIALNYQRLIDECNLTHEDLSTRLGKSRTAVTNHLRLLKLPPDIQSALKSKSISMGHARALAGVDDVVMQLHVCKEIINKGLSVRQTEAMIKQSATKSKTKTSSSKLPLAYQKLQDRLASNLSAKVQIKPKQNGSGEITIYFHDDDDLERLSEFLGS
ncbi:unnamed protein product [Cyprideis torosa]|uniref:ParB-like N-terminal domain-containing protein n=1 Tax=Cyprideis torosa TaxID=163714 RepID=A0A7R8WSA6_9CRUS|nr:unnamed protein product [Cyprideis torosa]CAG0908034.1 unnamed protein product [Cyprideis torosa]